MQTAPRKTAIRPAARSRRSSRRSTRRYRCGVLSKADWQHWINAAATSSSARPCRRPMSSGSSTCSGGSTKRTPADPSTWYAPQRREHKMKELNNTGMLEIYNHQHLWDNRHGAPRLRRFRRHLGPGRPVGHASTGPISTRRSGSRAIRTASSTGTSDTSIRAAAGRRAGRAQSARSRTATSAASSACPGSSSIIDEWVEARNRKIAIPCIPTWPGSASSISRWIRAT